jgi:hypothetical protein
MGIPLPLIVIVIPLWTVLWALLGFLVGRYHRRPKRYILVEDDGTWTTAKERRDAASVDDPIESEGSGSPETQDDPHSITSTFRR